MIERVQTEAYKGLRNVDVKLAPLTVLIGDNGTGKRSFVEYVSQPAQRGDQTLSVAHTLETATHPARLPAVMEKIRSMGGQVIATTYSPLLLDHVDLETDQVLLFFRRRDGTCIVREIDMGSCRAAVEEDFLLGEWWHNVGEVGLVARGSLPADVMLAG